MAFTDSGRPIKRDTERAQVERFFTAALSAQFIATGKLRFASTACLGQQSSL